MMSAGDMLRRVLSDITARPDATLRIVLVPWVLSLIGYHGPDFATSDGPLAIVTILSGGLITLIAWLWLAVAWHRYILAEEVPTGWLPPADILRLGLYLWKTILVLIPVAVMLLAALLLLSAIAVERYDLSDEMEITAGSIATMLVLSTLTTLLILRLGLILPAAAIDTKLGLGQAWHLSKPHAGALLGVAAALSPLVAAAYVSGTVLYETLPIYFLGTVLYDISSLVTVAVLTRLYLVVGAADAAQ